jgi:hypothetical protein
LVSLKYQVVPEPKQHSRKAYLSPILNGEEQAVSWLVASTSGEKVLITHEQEIPSAV